MGKINLVAIQPPEKSEVYRNLQKNIAKQLVEVHLDCYSVIFSVAGMHLESSLAFTAILEAQYLQELSMQTIKQNIDFHEKLRKNFTKVQQCEDSNRDTKLNNLIMQTPAAMKFGSILYALQRNSECLMQLILNERPCLELNCHWVMHVRTLSNFQCDVILLT